MIYNPTSITRCLSSQAVYFKSIYRQMFYYTDQNQIWYDVQDNHRILVTDITILQFERQRNNYVPSTPIALNPAYTYDTPYVSPEQNYAIIYVIETNCLYKYQNGIWTTIFGKYGQKLVAQTYLPNGTAVNINADDVTTNGILNDGSVVVRDNNKMICGLLSSNGYTFDIRSLIGGCLNIDPSGEPYGDGCLQLQTNPGQSEQANAHLNANLIVFGNIASVSPSNWDKQYRLITKEIAITTSSTIKAGSTLRAGSVINDTSYNEDIIVTEDLACQTGRLAVNSKIYKNSVINGVLLEPPYLFDIDNVQNTYMPLAMSVGQDKLSISNNILTVSIDTPFVNDGDCIFIKTPEGGLSNITKVQFNDGFSYNVDFIATEGINTTAKICYYTINNIVKILP